MQTAGSRQSRDRGGRHPDRTRSGENRRCAVSVVCRSPAIIHLSGRSSPTPGPSVVREIGREDLSPLASSFGFVFARG
jgi:hypothetical protein